MFSVARHGGWTLTASAVAVGFFLNGCASHEQLKPATRQCRSVVMQLLDISMTQARQIDTNRWLLPIVVTVQNDTKRDLQILEPFLESALYHCVFTDRQGTKWFLAPADSHLMLMGEPRDAMPSTAVKRGETREVQLTLVTEGPWLCAVNAHLITQDINVREQETVTCESLTVILAADSKRRRYYFVDCDTSGEVSVPRLGFRGR